MMNFARIEWRENNGSKQPYSLDFNDIYYSTDDGQLESEFVFVAQNQLPQRFAKTVGTFVVIETGFGTGLNFLVVADCWQRVASSDAKLRYIALENTPISQNDMQTACDCWRALKPISDRFLSAYKTLISQDLTVFRCQKPIMLANHITLELVFNEATDGLAQMHTPADAWLLDGYAPAKNPAMWNEKVFKQMARLSKPTTTFATFTSASAVRRGLEAAGFAVSKQKGFGKKREMLSGIFTK